MAKLINLTFEGYWLESDVENVPDESGVYCVYSCVHDRLRNQVQILDLIYIGEAGGVGGRIREHERWLDWKKAAGGRTLCFSYAPIGEMSRERAEAALIFKHKPPENTKYKFSFPFPDTTMQLSGEIALLQSYFTVKTTP